MTSRSSFENAEKVWLRELKNAADSNSSLLDSLVLVGNKVGRSEVESCNARQTLTALVVLPTLPLCTSSDKSSEMFNLCCGGYRSRPHRCPLNMQHGKHDAVVSSSSVVLAYSFVVL